MSIQKDGETLPSEEEVLSAVTLEQDLGIDPQLLKEEFGRLKALIAEIEMTPVKALDIQAKAGRVSRFTLAKFRELDRDLDHCEKLQPVVEDVRSGRRETLPGVEIPVLNNIASIGLRVVIMRLLVQQRDICRVAHCDNAEITNYFQLRILQHSGALRVKIGNTTLAEVLAGKKLSPEDQTNLFLYPWIVLEGPREEAIQIFNEIIRRNADTLPLVNFPNLSRYMTLESLRIVISSEISDFMNVQDLFAHDCSGFDTNIFRTAGDTFTIVSEIRQQLKKGLSEKKGKELRRRVTDHLDSKRSAYLDGIKTICGLDDSETARTLIRDLSILRKTVSDDSIDALLSWIRQADNEGEYDGKLVLVSDLEDVIESTDTANCARVNYQDLHKLAVEINSLAAGLNSNGHYLVDLEAVEWGSLARPAYATVVFAYLNPTTQFSIYLRWENSETGESLELAVEHNTKKPVYDWSIAEPPEPGTDVRARIIEQISLKILEQLKKQAESNSPKLVDRKARVESRPRAAAVCRAAEADETDEAGEHYVDLAYLFRREMKNPARLVGQPETAVREHVLKTKKTNGLTICEPEKGWESLLEPIPLVDKDRVLQAIKGCRRLEDLTDVPDRSRLRVGVYRVIFEKNKGNRFVPKIAGHRNYIYRHLHD